MPSPTAIISPAINSPNILGNIQARETAYKFEDFQFIANVMTDPNVLLVSADSPIKTLDDLIKAAQAKPGILTVGVAGVPRRRLVRYPNAWRIWQVQFSRLSRLRATLPRCRPCSASILTSTLTT